MTEKSEGNEDDSSVRVALRIRPQLAREKIDMCQICTTVMQAEKQVILGKDKAFTYDYVYDINVKQEPIYTNSVEKLIEGCFEGYNATVFAYGQTGSGKTYTMGTGFDMNIPDTEVGIIPRAVGHLFRGIESRRREALEKGEPPPDFKVNAQFMELYNEEILDLLDTTRDPENRGRKSNVKIHEDASGGIYVVGITTRLVHSVEETMQCLQSGALSRSTASTNMNATSSRSHAIFTLHIKQHRVVKEEVSEVQEEGKDLVEGSIEPLNEFETLTAKFHFVDLAGSERLKRTGATGDRAKEGISINCGLLALGNVISALGDKTKKGSHVPYRDSKLTRLLQDSLGGNSRTLMIACISPSDRDFMETLNTLKYANRARNITNKVIANQDKASKQLAILRSEIMELQRELNEYRSGQRSVNSEGVETTSDLYHENNMLQSENEKLRARIKSLNETIEALTVRNTELLAERALMNLGNAAGDVNSEEVTKLVQGYVKQLEELRARLAESEAMTDAMKRSRTMSASRLTMSPLMSPVASSSLGRSMELTSPDTNIATVLQEAKKDVRRLKKMKRSASKLSQDSDKENQQMSDSEEKASQEIGDQIMEEDGEVVEKDTAERSEKDEDESVDENGNLSLVNGEEEEDDTEDDELDELSSDSDSDSDGKDSDHIHEDLVELTCEISIKQRLIEELEASQKRLHSVKLQYEEKIHMLTNKIRETEAERDKVLNSLGKVETSGTDQTKKVKDQYERKLNDMQNELRKVQAAKKEHAKYARNQSHLEKQLKTLQHELGEMKKTKVRLMKQIKDDSEKSKQSEMRRNKELAALRKEQLKKEGRIRSLENEKRTKDMILKRKQEEVEVLRKKNRPMTTKTAGRVGRYDKPLTVPKEEKVPQRPIIRRGPTMTSSPAVRRRRRGEFSAKAAKHKWDNLEKNVNAVINKKQTITNIEKDMDIWLKHREKLGKKMEKTMKKREAMIALGNPENEINEIDDVIANLQNQVEFAQDNINECQSNIVQVEEVKDDAGSLDPSALVSGVSLEEAKYLLEHFVNLTITKGLALAAKESEARELNAKLHQTELNNTLQQDLLKHMMVDHTDIEVDNLMTNQVDDMESSTSSSSSSPVDSMFESRVDIPVPQKPAGNPSSSWEAAIKKDKNVKTDTSVKIDNRSQPFTARRRTANAEELLYAGQGEPQALKPVPETPDEGATLAPAVKVTKDAPSREPSPAIVAESASSAIPPVMSQSAPPATMSSMASMTGSGESATASLMPPPKSFPPRQASASRLPTVSPSLRRKDYTVKPSSRPSPSPSPVLRRKNSFTLLPRSSSVDNATSSDTTPPSSPTPSRRSERVSDANVFSRLTSSTAGISDFNAKRIVADTLIYGTPLVNRVDPDETAPTGAVSSGSTLFANTSNHVTMRGSIVAASSRVNIKQTTPLTCTHIAEGHTKAVLSVCATEDMLFTSSRDRTAKCWDLEAGKEVLSLPGHPNNVNVVKFCPRQNLVFTVSQSYVSVWDIRDRATNCIKTLSSSGLTQEGPVSSSQRQIDLPMGEHHINDIALNSTGTLLYSAGGNVVRVWDLRRFMAVGKLSGGHQAAIMVIGVDRNEDRDLVITGSKDHYIKVFEVMSEGAGVLTPKCNLEPPHYDGIQSLAVQGSCLFSGSRDMCIKKWDLQAQSLVQSVNAAHKDWICALGFMQGAGSDTLLSGCRGGILKLWTADTCSQVAEIKAHSSPINAIASNSAAVFTASNESAVKVWKLEAS